ncbi:hypothetical protein FRC00_003743 [Tulasnella sp. 408]|nr:hypothetical protein FRC00_003743 [Tulasnella sp. 408]
MGQRYRTLVYPGSPVSLFPVSPTHLLTVIQRVTSTGPDVFADISALPKRALKIAQKHSDFANIAKLRVSFGVTAASSPPASSTCQTAPTTPCLSQLGLRFEFNPGGFGDPDTPTNATTAVPDIVVSEDRQDRSFSAADSPSSTTITALFAHSIPTSQATPLTPRSNSTLDTPSDVEWDATDDPAGSTSLLTPPKRVIDDGRFPDPSLSSPYSDASFAYSTSTPPLTLQTPLTTPYSTFLDLSQSDVEQKTHENSPTFTALDTTGEIELPTSDSQTLGELASRRSEEAHLRDHRLESSGRTTLFEFDEEDGFTENDDGWKWAKREGKLPDLELTVPMPPPYKIANSTGDSRQVLPPVPTTPTLVETDDDEDVVDKQGFSRRDQLRAMAESRAEARARPFYGATTSSASSQPLSQQEWDMLEQYVAAPSRPKTEVRAPSPASPDVDTEREMVAPSWLPPPLPLPESTGPVRTKRLPRLGKFIKKLIPRNLFKHRSRADVAH